MPRAATTTLRLTSDAREVDWPALAALIARAPLGPRDPTMLRRVFTGSHLACFAFDGARLVGAAREISDGVHSSAIYDLVVEPDDQGRGLGRANMEFLLARLPPPSVLLVSVPGKEGFYRKLGFRRLKTAMTLRADWATWELSGYFEEAT